MGIKILSKDNVQIVNSAKDWKEAIKVSVAPLEAHEYVEERYKDEIIINVETMGPYIVLAPNIALPHARPEQGVINSQIAITLFKENIYFDKKDVSARLFVTLAAKDNESHLEALTSIMEIIQDEERLKKILESTDVAALYHYFVKF